MSVRRTRADRQEAIRSGLTRHVVGANRVEARRGARMAARSPGFAKVAEAAKTAQAPAAAPAAATAEAVKAKGRMKISHGVRMAAKRNRKVGTADHRAAWMDGSMFAPAVPFKGVLPDGVDGYKLAMDLAPDAMFEGNVGAAGAWAGDALNVSFAEGIGFLGYSYLAALTQRAEYRRPSERIATEMTRKWIQFHTVNKPEEYEAPGPEQKPGEAAGAMGVPADPDEAAASEEETDTDETRKRVKESVDRKRQLDKAKRIKDLEDRMRVLRVKDAFYTVAEGDGWFGRYHLFLDFGTDDAAELATPVGAGTGTVSKAKVGNKRGNRKLVAVKPIEPMWCYPANYNALRPEKSDWYNPEIWYVNGQSFHRSRLLRFVGREVPDILKPAYAFGGLSMSQMAKPYVDNWLRTRQAVCALIESFSVSGIYTNLTGVLEEGNDEAFNRIDVFNDTRANAGAFMLDKDTEEFFNVSTPLGTLDALQAQSQEQMSSVTGIPLIILLGITPKGLNASSEGEIRAFYDTIQAFQEQFFRDHLQTVINFIMLSLWGEVDEEITFTFVPLWSMTDKELAEIRKTEAETGKLLIDGGVITNAEERSRVANDPDSSYHDINPADVPEMPEQDDGSGDDPFGGDDDGGSDDAGDGGFTGAKDEWNESDHDRADNGQFGKGGGTSTATAGAKSGKGSGGAGSSSPALNVSKLTKSGGRLGSNEGGTYTDDSGAKFYVKKPSSQAHVANEKAAARLYQLAGVNTLKYREAGPDHVVTEWEALDKNRISQMTPAEKAAAAKDFGVHAWLSNWDAAGTGGDNQGMSGGKPVTLDVGGSLRYRAQGGPKGKAFGNKVTEIDTMRDTTMSPDAARLYGKMNEDQLIESVQRVTSIPDAKIRKAVGDDKELAATLIARKNDLAQRFKLIASDEAMFRAAMDAIEGSAIDDEDDEDIDDDGTGQSAEEQLDNVEEPGTDLDLANDDDELEEIAPDVFVLANDEGQFDESKIKRDAGGKFSTTGGAGGAKEGEEAEAEAGGGEKVSSFKTKKEHIAHLLTNGVTPKELMAAMGWPSVSMPAQAESLGMKLDKKDGKYFGTKMTAEELAAFKADKLAKKNAKQDAVTQKVVQQHDEFDWTHAQLPPEGPPQDFEEFKDMVAKAGAVGNTKMVDNLKNFNPAWAQQLDGGAAKPAPAAKPPAPAEGAKPGDNYSTWLGFVAEAAQSNEGNEAIKTKVTALFKNHPEFAQTFKENAKPAMVAKMEKAAPGIFDTKAKAPQATAQEKQKAVKSTPVQPHLVPGDKPETDTYKKEVQEKIDAFNEKWAGKDGLSDDALNEKVADFKQLVADQADLVKVEKKTKADILKAEQEKKAWELKKKAEEEQERLAKKFKDNPDLKTHFEAMESLFGGGSASQGYIANAKAKVEQAKLSKHLSGVEAVPIIAYSGSHYKGVNDQLRAGQMTVGQYKFQKSLNAALDKLPHYEGTTYRKANLTAEQFALYKEGMVVEERGFTSTSKNQATWSGSHTYEVHGKSGRDIQKLSNYKNEAEVLFKSGSRFYVESVKGKHIVLREL